jgi:methionyl-tRNA synthetase
LQGRDVLFVCGSDEHGVAISMKAKKEGITPQSNDKYDGIIRKSFSDFGFHLTIILELRLKFIHDTASEFFTTLYEKDFIEQVTEQLYDAKADQFLADRFVIELEMRQRRSVWRQCEQCGSL